MKRTAKPQGHIALANMLADQVHACIAKGQKSEGLYEVDGVQVYAKFDGRTPTLIIVVIEVTDKGKGICSAMLDVWDDGILTVMFRPVLNERFADYLLRNRFVILKDVYLRTPQL